MGRIEKRKCEIIREAGTLKASPWCLFEPPCAPPGRAAVGAWRQEGPDARNRPVVCVTCGRCGEESQNLRATAGNRPAIDPG